MSQYTYPQYPNTQIEPYEPANYDPSSTKRKIFSVIMIFLILFSILIINIDWSFDFYPEFKKDENTLDYPFQEKEEDNDGESVIIDSTNSFLRLYPTDDAQITENSPNNKLGSLNSMSIRNKQGTTPGWGRDILIKFSLSSVAPDKQIKSARLKLYYYAYKDNDPYGRILSLYRINQNWYEEIVTWISQPSYYPLPSSISIVPSSTKKWIVFDVTNDVKDFIDGKKTNYGWRIIDEESWGTISIPITYIQTKEYGENTPYLEIDFN